MDFNIARYALLMVRYRSVEDAISFIVEPEQGIYRHPFISYEEELEEEKFGMPPVVCLLCHSY